MARDERRRFLVGVLWAIIIVLINDIAATVFFSYFSDEMADLIFNIIRVVITLFVGWLVVWHSVGGLWQAALAGAALNFIDHVVLKGGYYLLSRNNTGQV